MPKPIIAITGDPKDDPEERTGGRRICLNWNYAQAVTDAGGVPLIVPPMADMREVARVADGWLIPGGNDIDASNFGQENHPEVELQDPSRFKGEKALFDAADPEMPILGICYGCQFINVARGGDLIQHLGDIEGRVQHTKGVLQTYRIEPDSHLAEVLSTNTAQGKSYHHQAVDRLGRDLRIVARNEDGTVEAVEATDRPWLIGVQWHPERTLEDSAMAGLFKAFVAAAARHADRRQAEKVGIPA